MEDVIGNLGRSNRAVHDKRARRSFYEQVYGSNQINVHLEMPRLDTASVPPLYYYQLPISSVIRDKNATYAMRLPVEFDLVKKDLVFRNPEVPHEVIIDTDPFESKFSVWYLLVDLIDIRKAILKLTRKGPIEFKRLRAIRKAWKTSPPKTLNDLGRAVANSHLVVQFGVLPTLADFEEFIAILVKWRGIYSDANAFLHKRYRRRYAHDVSAAYPKEYVFIHDYRGPASSAILEVRSVAKLRLATHHRVARYTYRCPELQGIMARLRQFVDAFGVFDPAALWDVIPWSFVIDWFIGVGPWLHKNMKPRLFPAEVVVDDYCESVRVVYDITWYVTYKGGPNFGYSAFNSEGVYTLPAGTEVAEVFHREVFQPKVVRRQHSGFKNPFSAFRVGIVSALLGQKVIPRG